MFDYGYEWALSWCYNSILCEVLRTYCTDLCCTNTTLLLTKSPGHRTSDYRQRSPWHLTTDNSPHDTWLQTTKSPWHRTPDYRQQSPHDTGHLTIVNKVPMTQDTWLQTTKSPWHLTTDNKVPMTPDYRQQSPHDTGHLTTDNKVPMTQDTWLQTTKSPWHLTTDNKVPMTPDHRQPPLRLVSQAAGPCTTIHCLHDRGTQYLCMSMLRHKGMFSTLAWKCESVYFHNKNKNKSSVNKNDSNTTPSSKFSVFLKPFSVNLDSKLKQTETVRVTWSTKPAKRV